MQSEGLDVDAHAAGRRHAFQRFVRWARGLPRATWVLILMVFLGVGLRIFASLSWWPAITTADSWPYASYAVRNPFDNPQHPAGYSTFLRVIGVATRYVGVPIILQHILGIAAALLLYSAVRRLTGSRWPGLVPAAFILLNSDQVFLEHSVMSESLFVFVLVAAMYTAVRALDDPRPLWRWPLATGIIAAAACMIRPAGLGFVAVVIIALTFAHRRPWRARWPVPAVVAASAGALLLAYGLSSLAANGRFEIGPAQGWHLYGRAATFADCTRFTPPEGTEALCESTPRSQRNGLDWYLYDPASPASQLYGPFAWVDHDDELRSFAMAAIRHQPLDYFRSIRDTLVAYYVPSSHIYRVGGGWHLDPQLDWSAQAPDSDPGVQVTLNGMSEFFDSFRTERWGEGLDRLHDYGRLLRFGATLLTVTTFLTLLGLLIGSRRARVGVFLFGVGGLSLFFTPILSGAYIGRYSSPLAGPLAAGAAITIWSLVRLERLRRLAGSTAARDGDAVGDQGAHRQEPESAPVGDTAGVGVG